MGCCLFVLVQVAAAGPSNDACDLPNDLQHKVASKYPGKKVVTLADLQDDDKGFFQKDHNNSCPGLVKVDFYGDGKPTLALVLIGNGEGKDSSVLVVARARLKQTGISAPWPLAGQRYRSDNRRSQTTCTIFALSGEWVACEALGFLVNHWQGRRRT